MATTYKNANDVFLYIQSLIKFTHDNKVNDKNTTTYASHSDKLLNSFIEYVQYKIARLTNVHSACVGSRSVSININYDPTNKTIQTQLPSAKTMFIRLRSSIKRKVWFRTTGIWGIVHDNAMLSEQEKSDIKSKLDDIIQILDKFKYNETTIQLFNNLNLK